MNIWGCLFSLVVLLWLFYEYLLYVKRKIKEIMKEYAKLQKAKKDLTDFLKKYKEDK